MSEFTEIIKKLNLENLMSYLIYGMDFSRESFENYEEKIENSFERLFDRLEQLYDGADRNDNRLFDTVSDFALLHDDIYFEAGVIIGFELVKILENGYQKHKAGDIEKILKFSNDLRKAEEKQTVMQQIIQERMDTALEETLRGKRTYQDLNKRVEKKLKELDKNKFTSEKWVIIDEVLSENNEKSSEYGRMAYQQGLLDTLNFLKNVLVI